MSYYRFVLELQRDTLTRLQSTPLLDQSTRTSIDLFSDYWPDDTDQLAKQPEGSSNSSDTASYCKETDIRYGPITVDWFNFMQATESSAKSSSAREPSTTDTAAIVPFTLGCTRLEQGVIHLYRDESTIVSTERHRQNDTSKSSSNDNDATYMASVLAVPAHMTPADLLAFLGSVMDGVSHIRLLRDVSPHRYIALLRFRESTFVEQFIAEYHGKPFSALEPEICQAVRVASVQLVASSNQSQLNRPPCLSWDLNMNDNNPDHNDETSLRELPTCPVCLERMDSRTTGLVTVSCQHTFHCRCLSQWGDGRCPVCRYTNLSYKNQEDDGGREVEELNSSTSSECVVCGNQTNLWICLICGHIGCGRYAQGHAREHYEQTTHCYALELETQRVWDYAGDGYVHRLIQNKVDGKLVELPDEMVDHAGYSSQYASNVHAASTSYPSQLKLDTIASEYAHLLTAQLDSQREHYEVELNAAYGKIGDLQVELEVRSNEASIIHMIQQENNQLRDELQSIQKQKMASDKKAEKLEKRLHILERLWDEEKQMNEGMRANQEAAQRAATERDKEIADLREQVRDLMFFMTARDKIEQGELGDELKDGSVQAVPSSSTGSAQPNSKSGGRRRLRKK
ncbi:hypothetical protein BDF22DRAFT_668854 [Syncephalis plumigaleata]|nr:hypothetical protein BDF22DRAFT_668854 [Syncephalis plumigaleata]